LNKRLKLLRLREKDLQRKLPRLNKLKNHQRTKLRHNHLLTQSQNKLKQALKMPVLLVLAELL